MRVFNIVFVLLFFSCSGRDETIAFVGTFSGSGNRTGLHAKNGLEIAVNDINTSGGIGGNRIILDIYDDKNDPSIAEGIDYGIAMKNYKVIIGHTTSEMSKAGLKALSNKQVIMISPYSSSNELSGLNDNFIRISAASRNQAEITARYANRTGYKRIYVMYDKTNISYVSPFLSIFSAETGKSSVIHKTIFESADEKTVSEIIYQSSLVNPDSFLILTSGHTLSIICQSLRINGFHQQIFTSGAAVNEDLLDNAGQHSEGIIFPHFIDLNMNSQQNTVFTEKYSARFGNKPSIASYLAYDSLMVLKQSLEDSGKNLSDASVDEIKESIIQKKNFSILSGSFSINVNGDAERKSYLYRITKGGYAAIDN